MGKLKKKKLEQIVSRTKVGGAEIVKYLQKDQHFMHQHLQE